MVHAPPPEAHSFGVEKRDESGQWTRCLIDNAGKDERWWDIAEFSTTFVAKAWGFGTYKIVWAVGPNGSRRNCRRTEPFEICDANNPEAQSAINQHHPSTHQGTPAFPPNPFGQELPLGKELVAFEYIAGRVFGMSQAHVAQVAAESRERMSLERERSRLAIESERERTKQVIEMYRSDAQERSAKAEADAERRTNESREFMATMAGIARGNQELVMSVLSQAHQHNTSQLLEQVAQRLEEGDIDGDEDLFEEGGALAAFSAVKEPVTRVLDAMARRIDGSDEDDDELELGEDREDVAAEE